MENGTNQDASGTINSLNIYDHLISGGKFDPDTEEQIQKL
jgi:hypothetical protein